MQVLDYSPSLITKHRKSLERATPVCNIQIITFKINITTRIWHWKSHWKTRVTLKIERTKDMIMSNAENLEQDYKGLTFLDINSRQISVWIKRKFQCDYLL